ncbi:MAG: hypothetical protein JST33_01270 [Actinobacteria bacterium]|nr:hypothetical protein [Actinomycetota bacterium]
MGSVDTPYGAVHVAWTATGDTLDEIRVTLPRGVVGEYVAPGGGTHRLVAGTSHFALR